MNACPDTNRTCTPGYYGYVVMREHVHLLLREPQRDTYRGGIGRVWMEEVAGKLTLASRDYPSGLSRIHLACLTARVELVPFPIRWKV
jgi:hypothetical protein